MKKLISIILVLSLLPQLFSCGYLLHKERRGQKGGKLDWVVVGLDTIGLLFFLIPGIIAFAIDIGTGTIYLPHTNHPLVLKDAKKIKINGELTKENIQAAIKKETGVTVNLDDPRLKIYDSEKKFEKENS